jgi:hypothetical protein
VETSGESRDGERASRDEEEVRPQAGEGPAVTETAGDDDGAELFPSDERTELERRWTDIQARFVDEPRGSVEDANALVAELVERLVSSFSEQRAVLESQWDRGEEVTTEELRVAFQRYRGFFGRLLAVGSDE